MSDPKEQQKAEEDQVAEDLTVLEEQAEEVGGGDLSFGTIKVTYTPQK